MRFDARTPWHRFHFTLNHLQRVETAITEADVDKPALPINVNDQREVIAHVSFCPPLSGPPEIETEDLDGANLEIRVGTAFPFGARLTVRRSGSTTLPYSARIGFVAVVAANQKAA